MCQYRAVGHPIAMTISDCMLEEAARVIGMDPVQIRRKNLIPDDAYPTKSTTGMRFDDLSHHACLDKLLEIMDYDSLLSDQAENKKQAGPAYIIKRDSNGYWNQLQKKDPNNSRRIALGI